MTVKIRKPFTQLRVETNVSAEPSMTKQSFAAACDINNIMRKYQRTGAVDHVKQYGAQYMDVDPITYHEAQNALLMADSMFRDLPSSLRSRFNNRPAEFLAFVQNPANLDEMRTLGLANPRVIQPSEAVADEVVATPLPPTS